MPLKKPTLSLPWINILPYGRPGVGKTTLAGSISEVPGIRHVLFCDAENGELALSPFNVDVMPIRRWQNINTVYNFLRLHVKLRDANDIKGVVALAKQAGIPEEFQEHLYDAVVHDSLTEMHTQILYQLLGVDRDGDAKLADEPDTPEFKEWGQASEMIKKMVRKFRDLPIHTVFTAQAQQSEDESGRERLMPELPGKLARGVQGLVDVVGYLMSSLPSGDGDAVQRRLYLRPSRAFDAKTRFADMKEVFLEDPNMSDLIKAANIKSEGQVDATENKNGTPKRKR